MKYLNLLIGLTLLVFLAAVYWYVFRPLPKSSGRINAPVSQAATVTRDAAGVPHIQAGTMEDAIFLQGYVTAQDRLWQMDAIRRYASGTLSEVIGSATVQADQESRRLRIRRLAEEHERQMPPEDRRWMAAFARGVNYFIETHLDALPIEFTILRYHPRPWTVVDSIAVGVQMFRDLTTSWKRELGKAAMLASGEPKLIAQLFPPRLGPEMQPGSNAWVVSGKHTASGKPLLSNDPHLEWSVPSKWYMVHLQAPGLNAGGVTLPGLPGVILGHNDRIAWGATNLQFDVQDLYIERLNPQSGQFVFKGQVEQARLERELIPVKDGKPVEFTNWITRHGPLWTIQGNQAISIRWTAAEPGHFQFPFVQLNMARNWEDFRSALRRFPGPGQNFIYTDVDGNIGYQATGALPVRRNYQGDVPVDGSSGNFEWDGFIPFDELPSVLNPPSGIIVSANQNPFPQDWKYTVSGDFASGFRAQQIRTLLNGRSGWKPEDMLAVQKDVYSPFLHALAREVVQAADRHGVQDPSMKDAVQLLRSWNGQMEKGTAAPMVAQLAYQQLRNALAERASSAPPASYISSMAPAAILRIAQERQREWFPDWNQVLVRCLLSALDEGRKAQGRNVAKWDYGQLIAVHLKHPIISGVPYIGGYFDIGPAPMSGSSTTVKQTSVQVGPSMRFVADTSNWERSLNNVTIGQSGQILSSHYKDQWEPYWAGRSLPMRWRDVPGAVLRVEPGR